MICSAQSVTAVVSQALTSVMPSWGSGPICDHILHFLELDPQGSHIALGGDLDGCESLPEGFDGVQSYPALAERLLERGVDHQTVENIFWDNAFGVMERAVCNHP